VIGEVAKWPGRPSFFDAWVTEQPRCALAYLLRGAHGVEWAWEARTAAAAADVAKVAWPVCFKRLKGARRDLERALKWDAHEGAAFGPLLRVARGLQLGEAFARSRLEAARKRNPHDFPAHHNMLLFMCKKWHGTHQKMFEFAREKCHALDDGNVLHALLVLAHHELVL
jgi:hypothetical protein